MIIIIDATATDIRCVGMNGHRRTSVKRPVDDVLSSSSFSALLRSLSGGGRITAIAFRLPFGGDTFVAHERITADLLSRYRTILPDMPLLVSANHAVMCASLAAFPDTPQIAFFETAFFAGLPDEEKYYAIPREYRSRAAARRFGTHGLYHEYNSLLAPNDRTVISIVLENQTTVCALHEQHPRAITAGATLLEGVMGRTTPGDVDPGIIFYLMRRTGYSIFRMNELLTRNSGFVGLTGYDMSIRDLFAMRGRDEKAARAFDIYERQLLRSVGEAIALLGGCDAILFSGAHCSFLEPFIHTFLKDLAPVGVSLTAHPWKSADTPERISAQDSRIAVFINRADVYEIIYEEASALACSTMSA